MKGFVRKDQLLSLCGLNCGLCVMMLDGRCPGCGGGEGNQSCAIARCSLAHGGLEYCWQCDEFPCRRYEGIDAFDSFITHRRQMADMERARLIGPAAYQAEQLQKRRYLLRLLEGYNDGRRKSFFCMAVNLLDIQDVEAVMKALEAAEDQPLKEKAAKAAGLLRETADRRGIELKLRKKSAKR